MSTSFSLRLQAVADTTEETLDRLLSTTPHPGEIKRPERLLAAMRYAALGGGKRLRPFLLIESAGLFGDVGGVVAEAAAALECVHCYSLVHDDLPAMDNDDLRRGRPTVHRAFDEATAILAGDALLTIAFDILSHLATDTDVRIALIGGLARAAGLGGMAGGQMLDMAADGTATGEPLVRLLQSMKTGALLRFACEAGSVLGGAGNADRGRLIAFGETIGQAFQLADDLIDATGQASVVGKATAKDAEQGKATLVALYGVEESQRRLNGLVATAIETLAPFGARADMLAEAARFIGSRSR